MKQDKAEQKIYEQEGQSVMTVTAEGELTIAWGWVLVGTALSQVIGAPIAAGRRYHFPFPPSQLFPGAYELENPLRAAAESLLL